VLPVIVTTYTIPQLTRVYAEIGLPTILIASALGIGWGVAQVMFGLAVDSIGIALAFSIVPGMSVALGSLIPLFYLHPEKMFSKSGLIVMLGVALAVLGVVVCAVAGGRKHAQQQASGAAGRSSFSRGLLIAICSGSGAAMVNFGLAFGNRLIKVAVAHGADSVWAPNVIWLPVMLAGSIPNILYCVHLIRRNRTAERFLEPGRAASLLRTVAMALFWFGSTSLYGVASGMLGSWGTIVGWPVFMTVIVMTAGILGVVTGEWRNTGTQPLRIQFGGMAVLIAAIFVLWNASRSIP
jgi:L-rhamnose-H+ transport protein